MKLIAKQDVSLFTYNLYDFIFFLSSCLRILYYGAAVWITEP